MKREILFRGKTEKDEWVFGHFVKKPSSNKHQIINDTTLPINVIPESVGQFTGLIDKDCNRIFEGDLINYGRRMYEVIIGFNGYHLQRYKLWRGKFVPSYQYSMSLFTLPNNKKYIGGKCEEAEVIGNIFDNPELIKTKLSKD